MPFDPDTYLAEKTGGSATFNPDQYLAEKTQPQPSTLLSRDQARTANIMAPTVAGDLLGLKQGTYAEGFAGAPERLYRTAGAAVGSAVDMAATPVKAVAKGAYDVANVVSGGSIQRGVDNAVGLVHDFLQTKTGQTIAQGAQKAGKAIGDYWNGLPESVKANYRASGDLSQAIGFGEGAPIAKAAVGEVADAAAGTMEAQSLADALASRANRMQGTKVKIGMPEMKQGADNSLYGKYGVFGNADQVHAQWKNKISQVADQLNTQLATAAQDPENNVNVSGVLGRARERLTDGGNMSAAEKTDNATAFSKVAGKIEKSYLDKDGNPVDANLLEAQMLKRYVGKYGDWLSNPGGGIRPSPDATIESRAYNAIYDELKDELENKGGAGIKELNSQLSEMIPMERAAGKQVLVSNRKNPMSIDDFIGGLAIAGSAGHGNLLPAAVVGANVISKSPTVAKTLYNMSEAIKLRAPNYSSLQDLSNQYRVFSGGLGRILGNERGAVGAGEPIRVFRGISGNEKPFHDPNFPDQLNNNLLSDENTQAQGIYFTTDKDIAHNYTGYKNKGSVGEYLLNLKNPFEGDIADFYKSNISHDVLEKFNGENGTKFKSIKDMMDNAEEDQLNNTFGELNQENGLEHRALDYLYGWRGTNPTWRTYDLENAGYDGQIDLNSKDKQIIAFHPSQIQRSGQSGSGAIPLMATGAGAAAAGLAGYATLKGMQNRRK